MDQPREAKPPTGSTNRELFTEPPGVPVKISRAEKYVSVYASNAQVAMSYYDIRLHFNDVLSATAEGMSIEELVTVIMSVEHARDLHVALGKGLMEYERKYGPIRAVPRPPLPAQAD